MGIVAAIAAPAWALTVGPQVPLAQSSTYVLAGDFTAAGVGMRNLGGGTIDLALPQGTTTAQAFLYWAIVAPDEPANTGRLNGHDIAGTLIAQTGDPCWPNQDAALVDPPTVFAWVFRADVTGFVMSGQNALSDFPSGLTGGEDPLGPDATSAFPLLDGASLVVVYADPTLGLRSIVIHDGGQTFLGADASTTLHLAMGAFVPISARTAYVVADGQGAFTGDRADYDGTPVAGPGATTEASDAFDGADGGGPTNPQGLWDTLLLDVSGIVQAGGTAGTAKVVSGDKLDCLTWVAQVLSVQIAATPTTTTTLTTRTTTTTRPSTTSTTTSTTATTATTTSSTTATTSSTTTTTTTSTSTTEESTTSTSSTSTSSTSTSSTSTSSTSSTTATSSTSTTATTSTSASTTSAPTTSSSTTTTTTLPSCDRGATFASITCRIDLLDKQVLALGDVGHLRDLLLARVRHARLQVTRAADKLDHGRKRAASTVLRASARDLTTFAYRVNSLLGSKALPTGFGETLLALSEAIKADIVTLSRSP